VIGMTEPADPIAAATHADPYPYYAALAQRGLHRDPSLGLWVAASADDVTAVLTNPACRVRPPAEPVPASLLGSPAAEIFRHLVRMNDGERHCPFKQAVGAALGALTPAAVAEQAARCASRLAADDISDFAFRLPAHTVAALLGAPGSAWDDIADWTGAFVRCITGGTEAEIARGKIAAGKLLELFRAPSPDGLLGRLAREAERLGRGDPDVVLANGVGFLSQAYEASAGLIGNTLVALRRGQTGAPGDVVRWVERFDPPVQNTRRFLAEDAVIAGQPLRAGETILVVLAAASRDPKASGSFTFGRGAHACPGEAIALAIAETGVARLLEAGATPVGSFSYRRSANTRIPLFER
jgi:cytochrome P450